MIFRIYHETLGGHVHMRVFAGKSEGALGKCGDLCMRTEEFEFFRDLLHGLPVDFRSEDRSTLEMSHRPFEAGVAHERQRCLDIVNAARGGDIDGSDLRSLRHFIESGKTVEQVKAL